MFKYTCICNHLQVLNVKILHLQVDKEIEEINKDLQELDITAYQVAQGTGIAQSTIGRMLNGETKRPNATTITTIRNYIKSVKSGNAKPGEKPTKEHDAVWVNFESFKLVPLVTHRAQAGFLAGWGDDEYLDELPKVPWEVDREYKGKYMTFEVSGDSMESDTDPRESLFEGDLLLCREVQRIHWKNKLHIHKWDFVIVHREQGILVKRIKEHVTGNGTLVLHSLNPYYEDFNVEMDDLIAIFNIVDVKRSRRR